MTAIVGLNLIEGPILASDSRATERKTKKASDTATKIIPLWENLAVGIAGNPIQAVAVLREIHNFYQKNKDSAIFNPKNLLEQISEITQKVDPVDINDSRCDLVFAGINLTEKQEVPSQKIRYYWEKENEQFINGEEGVRLITSLLANKNMEGLITFNFPRSYVFSFSYPSREIREIDVLGFDSWGSGRELLKNEISEEFHKLWTLKMLPNVPFMKSMMISAQLEEVFLGKGKEVFVGGLPQVVTIDKNRGVVFQGYERRNSEGKILVSMKFDAGSWVQTNGITGRTVRTFPSLMHNPTFDPSEVVEFIQSFEV